MTALLGFHHVSITVRDLDVSASWYAAVLGFEEVFREDGDDRRASVMRFPGGRYGVGLVEHAGTETGAFDPRRIGLDHVAFAVGSIDDLRQWAGRLDRAGVRHSGVVDVPPGAIVNFSDPDGVALALFWDRA